MLSSGLCSVLVTKLHVEQEPADCRRIWSLFATFSHAGCVLLATTAGLRRYCTSKERRVVPRSSQASLLLGRARPSTITNVIVVSAHHSSCAEFYWYLTVGTIGIPL
jgi:hypothetical protein